MGLPSEEVLRDLVARYASLLAAHGDAFEGAELVTPTSEHFPDHFARDAESVARLLVRTVSYTPLGEDVPLELAFVEDNADDGHCASGCSKPNPGGRIDGVQRVGHGYRIAVPVTELSNPTRLVCALVRSVSAAVLAEAGDGDARDVAMMSEIVATASGFGVVLLEASHVYTKSCGGPSIHQGTFHGPGELAVLLAVFSAMNELPARAARKHLGATQCEVFDEAWAFVQKNEPLIEKLREAPELLEGGAFAFESKRGLLSRLFTPSAPAAKRPRTRDADEERKLAEARALVDGSAALGGTSQTLSDEELG
jgi:hypothetical protein